VDVYINVFLISALVGGEWSASLPGRFIPGTHLIGDWVGPRAGEEEVKRRKILSLLGLELRPKVLNEGHQDVKFRHDVFITSPLGNVTAASL
jgi:hypothetical protein